MYTTVNYPTKKALREAVANGQSVGVYQPNDMFGATDKVQTGQHEVSVEGPHYPKPHRWYARVTLRNGKIVSVK